MRVDPELAEQRRQRLADLCAARSQKAVSDATGISLSQMGQWINGVRNLTEGSCRRIEQGLLLPKGYFDLDKASLKAVADEPTLTPDHLLLIDAFDGLLPEQQQVMLAEIRKRAEENRRNFEIMQRKFGVKKITPDKSVAEHIDPAPNHQQERPATAPRKRVKKKS